MKLGFWKKNLLTVNSNDDRENYQQLRNTILPGVCTNAVGVSIVHYMFYVYLFAFPYFSEGGYLS